MRRLAATCLHEAGQRFFDSILRLIALFTRPVAFVLPPSLNQGEAAVLFSFILLFIAAAGAGPWSIDAWRRRAPTTGAAAAAA